MLYCNKNICSTLHKSSIKKLIRFSSQWNSVIGLEVHAQISSKSKIFSSSSTSFMVPVNTSVSFHDASIPGTLPVLNKRCVEAGILTALALNCKVNLVSSFDRKHYFYADMPTGYQITQQRNPLASNGLMSFYVYTPGVHKKPFIKNVKIKQLQLEQDSGKSLHDVDRTLIDLNRVGTGLMEIVFEPDLTDGEEAAALIKELCAILKSLGTCSCKMEEGALRIDANVSVNKKNEPLGVRAEIKNIGSVRAVASAIKYEIKRQIEIKNKGGQILNETRAWDAVGKKTVPMRDKEEKQDYRYMPEPNLPYLHLSKGEIMDGCVNVDIIQQQIPELPYQTRERLKLNHDLSQEQAIQIVNDDVMLYLFENILKNNKVVAKLVANVLLYDLQKLLNKNNIDILELKDKFKFIGDSIELVESNTISRNTLGELFQDLINGTPKAALEIVKEKKLTQITNEEELQNICKEVLNLNPKAVEQYKDGKTKVFKFFLGEVAKSTKDRADMKKCNNILKELLK